MSELESLFSTALPVSGHGRKSIKRGSVGKSEKVQLENKIGQLDFGGIDSENQSSIRYVDEFGPFPRRLSAERGSGRDPHKFLSDARGDGTTQKNLGRSEQFLLELMQVPRVESKLRVFSFKIQFRTQVSELRHGLNVVNAAS